MHPPSIVVSFNRFEPVCRGWPRVETDDSPDRRDESLMSAIPRLKRRVYDPYPILESVFDQGSFFEIAPKSGRANITGLARVNGYSVGVMINNPRFYGGAMGPIEAAKSKVPSQLRKKGNPIRKAS